LISGTTTFLVDKTYDTDAVGQYFAKEQPETSVPIQEMAV